MLQRDSLSQEQYMSRRGPEVSHGMPKAQFPHSSPEDKVNQHLTGFTFKERINLLSSTQRVKSQLSLAPEELQYYKF